jgi:serine/threonine protein phosphatase 1
MEPQLFQGLDGPHQGVHLPDDQRVYAIGDVHGRLDLLIKLLELVNKDITTHTNSQNNVVFLGDYIDRGPDSAGVIDHLIDLSIPHAKCIFLMGNHERYMMNIAEGTAPVDVWFQNGGKATVKNYGIDAGSSDTPQDLDQFRRALKENVPDRHWRFLHGLQTSWRLGSVFFAHAGVNPARSLDQQTEQDLIWIREKFLHSERNHGALIVHGHTPGPEPEVLRNRINVDTLAYQSGHLTAVVLKNGHCRFLTT